MTGIEILILMVFAHLLADWTLQTPIQAQNKAKNWYIMGVHCFIWTVAIFIPPMIMGHSIYLCPFVLMYFIHWMVDDWKCWIVWEKVDKEGNDLEWNDNLFKPWHLYVDQGIHLVQIIALFAFYMLT